MKALFAKPIVSRLVGALGAGVVTYFTTNDAKSSIVTAATFLVYGSAHKATEQAATK